MFPSPRLHGFRMGSVVAMPRGMRLLSLHRAEEGGPPAAVEWRCVVPREDGGKEEMHVPPRLNKYYMQLHGLGCNFFTIGKPHHFYDILRIGWVTLLSLGHFTVIGFCDYVFGSCPVVVKESNIPCSGEVLF